MERSEYKIVMQGSDFITELEHPVSGSIVIVNKMGKSTLLMTQTFTKHPRIYLS